MQEAFLAIWRGAARFLPERGKASTWILTLVHRRAVDLVRREERRRAEPLPEVEPAARERLGRRRAWLRLERERVQAALAQLPDQQREAIELAYYGGFTQSELAERLGEPLGTIKSRMFAGLARLRELLESEETHGPRHPPRPDRRLRARRARRLTTRAAYEQHLAGCERCRDDLAALQRRGGRARLRRRSRSRRRRCSARPHPRRGTRAERPNVVPLRPRTWARPACRGRGCRGLCRESASGSGTSRSTTGSERRAARRCAACRSPARPARSSSAPAAAARSSSPNLAAAPAGKTYEAWVIEARQALPAGTFGGGGRTIVSGSARALPGGCGRRRHVERGRRLEQPTRKPFITSRACLAPPQFLGFVRGRRVGVERSA